jgi:predicted ATPase
MKIGIIGPPGAGKTTLAAGLFYNLKKLGKTIELVPELIKYKVYQGRDFARTGFDIANNLEQRSFEESFSNAVPPIDFILCEAPLCNGFFYASYYNKEDEAKILRKIAKETINNYDIILQLPMELESKENYQQHGRKETYDQSKELNDFIFNEFKKLGFKKNIIKVNSRDDIMQTIAMILQLK